MVARIIVIFLCLGILGTVNGCYSDPYPYGTYAPYGVTEPHEPYQGQQYEREMDREEQQYRRRRSEQEQEQELAQQQWEQERARERDPRWER